ncbi:leucine-rich repeat-containing protein 15-like [Venturia canescens]|uniref:leucine-rich repeat-containing protein 15-like n=1 Tax=Venturia canescens TaxID=32260 RepID=UPI001C9C8AA0|nr:leucine-rich repeat-containing protein 15-like [Venturia canescens]
MLYLADNRLTDLPSRLAQLRSLEVLDLSRNRMSNIPSTSSINQLPNLHFLKLTKNPLRSLRGISVRSLVSLEADNCEISGVDHLIFDSLPSLRTLNVTGNPLKFIDHLVSENLTELVLKDCQLMDIPAETFDGLPNLQNLDLCGNQLKTLPNEIFLHNMKLVYLSLSNNTLERIKNSWFEEKPNLQKLDLSENEITSIEEAVFAKLFVLSELNLGGNRVRALPNLKTSAINVNLAKNSIENRRLWDLSDMAKVRKLDLSKNRFDGDCDEFKSVSLRILDLGFNNMTRVKRNSFSKVPSLTDLSLKGNKISHGADLVFDDATILVDIELDDNPWHCNCSDLLPLYTWLQRGQRAALTSLICFTPKRAKGNTWWEFCSEEWKDLLKSNSSTDSSKIWLIIVSIAFGLCLVIASFVYIIYTCKKNNSS